MNHTASNIVLWSGEGSKQLDGVSIASLGGGLVGTSGCFQRLDTNDADAVITHNLGKTPTQITTTWDYFYGGGPQIRFKGYGTYNNSGNTGIYSFMATGSAGDNGQSFGSYIIYVSNNGAKTLIGTVSAVTSTTFTISWVKSGGDLNTDIINVLWNAIG